MNELDEAGRSLKLEDVQNVIISFFSTHDGFKKIPETECHMFCMRLYAIHICHTENEVAAAGDDTNDGNEDQAVEVANLGANFNDMVHV